MTGTHSPLSEVNIDHERKLTEMAKAIFAKDAKAIQSQLQKSPAPLFFIKSHKGNRILHLAVQHGTQDIIESIVTLLTEMDILMRAMSLTNDDGDNPLHLAARYNSVFVLQYLINSLGECTHLLARMCNNEGELPIELVNTHSTQTKEEKKAARQLLLKHTLFNSLIPLHAEFKLPAEFKTHPDMQIFCKVINETRNAIAKCNSHPQTKNYDAKTIKKLESDLGNLEVATSRMRNRMKTDEKQNRQILKDISDAIRQAGVGNCKQYGYVAMELLVNTYGYRCQLVSAGDHVVILVNGDLKNMNDAYIVDPWIPNVYLANQIQEKLQSHVYFQADGQDHHAIVFYNPKAHPLIPHLLLAPETSDSPSKIASYAKL